MRGIIDLEIEVAIMSLPIENNLITTEPLFDDPLYLALSPGHELLKMREIRAKDLRNVPFIALEEDHCLGEQINNFLLREADKPRGRLQDVEPFDDTALRFLRKRRLARAAYDGAYGHIEHLRIQADKGPVAEEDRRCGVAQGPEAFPAGPRIHRDGERRIRFAPRKGEKNIVHRGSPAL